MLAAVAFAVGAGEEEGCAGALPVGADFADAEALSAAVRAGMGGVGKSGPGSAAGFSGAGEVVTGGESILATELGCAAAAGGAGAGAAVPRATAAPPRSTVIRFE